MGRKKTVRPVFSPDMRFEDIPYFVSTAEAALILDVTDATIRRAIRQGKLKAETIGGQYRICREVLFPKTREALDGKATA